MHFISSTFRRSAHWAQPLFEPPTPDAQAAAAPEAGDAARDSTLRGTLDMMRLGSLTLCATAAPSSPPAQDLHDLLKVVGRERPNHVPGPEVSDWGEVLRSRIEKGHSLAVLHGMAERMADDASAAARASHGGALAHALQGEHTQAAPELADGLRDAKGRVDGWIDSLEKGFHTDGGWPGPAVETLSALRRARTALGRIEGDFLRCRVDAAIQDERLPPEAAVLGKLAVLADLDPEALDLDHAHDRNFPNLTRLARTLTAELEGFSEGLRPEHAELLRSLPVQGMDAQAAVTRATDAVTRFIEGCPDESAHLALSQLRDALVATATSLPAGAQHDDPERLPAAPARLDTRAATAMQERARDHWSEAARVRTALQGLWHDKGNNEAITARIGAVLDERMPRGTRIELARVALHFMDEQAEGFGESRRQLCKRALGVAGGSMPSSRDIDHVAGTPLFRQQALQNKLLDIVARLEPQQIQNLADELLPGRGIDFTQPSRAPRLPASPDWLSSGKERRRLCERYALLGDLDARRVLHELKALASDLPTLRGQRHHLVHLLKNLLKCDLARTDMPAQRGADWMGVISPLLAQATDDSLGHATGDMLTRNAIVDLASHYLRAPRMDLARRHKARLAQELVPMVRHLSSGRWSGVKDGQGRALLAVNAALPYMRSEDLGRGLLQILDERSNWSTQRRASSNLPGTRKGLKRFSALWTVASLVDPLLAVIPLSVVLAGGASPKDKARMLVTQTLTKRLEILQTHRGGAEVEHLLPVCQQLLQECGTSESPRPQDIQVLGETVRALVSNGLPGGLSQVQRDRFLSLGLGDDPAMRAAMVQVLTAMCLKQGPGTDPGTRIAAARYLQNLVASDGDRLGAAAVQAARAAIQEAATSSTRKTGGATLRIVGAMLQEARRDNIEMPPGMAGAVTALAINSMQDAPAEVATQMPTIAGHYASMPGPDRARLNAALLARLPTEPATQGPDAAPQLLAVGWFNNLAAFGGHTPPGPGGGQEVPRREIEQMCPQLWRRLNPVNQDAVLSDLFNGYAEAAPQGRAALRSFFSTLDSDKFVTAGIQLVKSVLADPQALQDMDAAEREATLSVLLNRLPSLSVGQVSELATSTSAYAEDWPLPLAQSFERLLADAMPREVQLALRDRLGQPHAPVAAAQAIS